MHILFHKKYMVSTGLVVSNLFCFLIVGTYIVICFMFIIFSSYVEKIFSKEHEDKIDYKIIMRW